MLQPLDKFLNNPFKDNMRWQYLSWLTTGPFEFTPAGKKKAPSQNLEVLEIVRRSFKICGISNALDRKEDDAIYDCPEIDADDEEMEEEFDTDSDDDDER